MRTAILILAAVPALAGTCTYQHIWEERSAYCVQALSGAVLDVQQIALRQGSETPAQAGQPGGGARLRRQATMQPRAWPGERAATGAGWTRHIPGEIRPHTEVGLWPGEITGGPTPALPVPDGAPGVLWLIVVSGLLLTARMEWRRG